METEKICRKCGLSKPLSLFYAEGHNKTKTRSSCKACDNLAKREYARNNKHKLSEYAREYNKTHKEEKLAYARRNKEKANGYKKKYIINNPEKRLEQSRRYYANNKQKRREYEIANREKLNEKRRVYRQTHPQESLAHNLRSRIGAVLSGISKGGRLHLLVGCNMIFLKEYLQSFFTEGMTWDNYGRGVGKWSLDHTIPLNTFNLEDEEEQKKAFHYTNMRPMWYVENSSKGDFFNGSRISRKKKNVG